MRVKQSKTDYKRQLDTYEIPIEEFTLNQFALVESKSRPVYGPQIESNMQLIKNNIQ